MRQACAAALLVLLAGLPACTVGPNYAPPKTDVPAQWASPLEGGELSSSADFRAWWTVLGDERLNGLMDEAAAGNLDLEAARARILQARALLRIAGADELPTLDAAGSYSRSRSSETTGGPGIGEFEDSTGVDNWRAGFDATWELDFFGRVRRNVEAARADLERAVEDRRDVLVTLMADVASAYTDLRTFQARLAIAENNVRIQRETVSLSNARVAAGLSSELDLARASAQLATTEASIPPLRAGVRTTMYRLEVLLGRQPGTLAAELTAPAGIPRIPGELPVGLPSELLRRRPDVRAAERDLAAQTARIGVATADLFPRFSLTGSLGVASEEFGDLFDINSRFWSIGPSFRWNVFDRGRIRATIALQEARADELLAGYRQRVLLAFEDVERALTNYAREQERLAALQRASAANERSVELATQLYTRGLTDFFSVLDTQRLLFQSQDERAVSERQTTANLIALYKALGGGWDPEEPGGTTSFDPPPADGTPADEPGDHAPDDTPETPTEQPSNAPGAAAEPSATPTSGATPPGTP